MQYNRYSHPLLIASYLGCSFRNAVSAFFSFYYFINYYQFFLQQMLIARIKTQISFCNDIIDYKLYDLQKKIIEDYKKQTDMNNIYTIDYFYQQNIPQANINKDIETAHQKLKKLEVKMKNDLKFWNELANKKLENVMAIVNLFLLLLLYTFAHQIYLGKKTDARKIIGWICVAQTTFFYFIIAILKSIYIPSIQRKIQNQQFDGFTTFYPIYHGLRQLKTLSLQKIEQIILLIKSKSKQLKHLFPNYEQQTVKNQINMMLKDRFHDNYKQNLALTDLKLRQKDAIWWRAFWQQFIADKTFTMPSIIMLVFIITSISNAETSITSKEINNAQGWLAVGFLVFAKLLFIIIKIFLWKQFNKKVQLADNLPFLIYNLVYLSQKKLKDLKLHQLQIIQVMLQKRKQDFGRCFQGHNSQIILREVIQLVKIKLPKKYTQYQCETGINNILQKQKHQKRIYQTWLYIFNSKIISFIINTNKLLVVIAVTFVINYIKTEDAVSQAQKVIGYLGVGNLVINYIFYIVLKCCLLEYLQSNAHKYRAHPFFIYRKIYYGYRPMKQLKIHQLQDINYIIEHRKDEFIVIFPNNDINNLKNQIKQLLQQNKDQYKDRVNITTDLNSYKKAYKLHQFFTTFSNGYIFAITYSIYGCIVLVAATIARSERSDLPLTVLGWIVVAVLALLIIFSILIKLCFLKRLKCRVVQLHIKGYSEFYHFYIQTKKLKDFSLVELQNIQQIIQIDAINFQRCFPKMNLKDIYKKVKQAVIEKKFQKTNIDIQNLALKDLKSKLNEVKQKLLVLTIFINQEILVILPLFMFIFKLWAQTIARNAYGKQVCGFLGIAFLAVIFAAILLYKLCYQDKLTEEIKHLQKTIVYLDLKNNGTEKVLMAIQI